MVIAQPGPSHSTARASLLLTSSSLRASMAVLALLCYLLSRVRVSL